MQQPLARPPAPSTQRIRSHLVRTRARHWAFLWVVAALGLPSSCATQSKPPRKKAAGVAPSATAADAPTRAKIAALWKRDESHERNEPPEAMAPGARHAKVPFILDDLVDVAPAGPAAAATEGVVLITKSNEVRLAPLGSSTASTRAVTTPITPMDGDPKEFVARARGPAVLRHAAYWVAGSRLVRQAIAGGPLEVLASDARAYTQVASPGEFDSQMPAMVAYIAMHPSDPQSLIAKLWVQGQAGQTLSPEGTTANCVTLVQRQNDWLALFLEARTGMSPLHARPIALSGSGAKLGADFIAWVAGSAQPMTPVRAISDAHNTWAFSPIERDIARFGLARIHVTDADKPNQEVSWRDYPNGMDPALTATAIVCGKPTVLYSRPSSPAPHAPQELHVATVSPEGLGPSTLIGSSRGYSDISLVALDAGALVVFVADHRTWARRMRCTH